MDHQMDLPLDTFGRSQNFGFNQDHNDTSLGVFQHGQGSPEHYRVDISSDDGGHYQTLFSHPSLSHLHEDVSTWDYINPFNVVEDIFPNFYPHGSYGVNFMGNYMDLRELVEGEEGVPDLEDELDDPIMEDTLGEGNLEIIENSGEYLSEAIAVKDARDDCLDQKEVRSSGDDPKNIRNEKNDDTKKEDSTGPTSSASEISRVEETEESKIFYGEEDSFQKEMEKSKGHEGRFSSSQMDESVVEIVSNISVNSLSDLQEVVTEIKVAFDDIIVHGKDVYKMLGPCQIGIALNKGLSCSSCIEDLAASPRETSGRRPTYRTLKMMTDGSENLDNETSMTLNSLTLTLENLCIWEKKLYEEVKKEERLRQNFDKEWRKLKKLDDKGAESSKVDVCHSELKRMTPLINVAVSAVEGIARKTHTIRDEELHPQLCELIQRMHTFWRFSFESHKKQVKAMSKVPAVVGTTCKAGDSSLKATENLKAWIHNLGTAFSDCAKSQRALAQHLNDWLSKFLPQQPPDQTPALFSMCCEWRNALEGVPENDVRRALDTFGQLVHQLCLDLHDEALQRVRIEHLSGYHERKLRSFCMQNGLDLEECASFIRDAPMAVESGFSALHGLYSKLRPIRIKLREARGKHEEALTRVNAAGADIVRDGFVPVLEALEGFSLGMVNAFERIGMPSETSTKGS